MSTFIHFVFKKQPIGKSLLDPYYTLDGSEILNNQPGPLKPHTFGPPKTMKYELF